MLPIMSSIQDAIIRFTSRGPAQNGIVFGVGAGAFYGIWQGFENHAYTIGIAEGIAFGIVMTFARAFTTHRKWQQSGFDQVDVSTRVSARRALVGKEEISDTRVAPLVIQLADTAERAWSNRSSVALQLALFGTVAVGSIWYADSALLHNDVPKALCLFLLPVLMLWSLTRVTRNYKRSLQAREQARKVIRASD